MMRQNNSVLQRVAKEWTEKEDALFMQKVEEAKNEPHRFKRIHVHV